MQKEMKEFLSKYLPVGILGLILVLTVSWFAIKTDDTQAKYIQPVNETEMKDAFGQMNWDMPEKQSDILGAAFRPINFKTSLAQRLTDGGAETTITVSSVTTVDSHTLTMGDIGDIVYLMIDSGTNNWELVSCTGLSSLTFSGCTRGYVSYANSTDSARKKPHSPGATVIITNDDHYLSTQYPQSDEDATVSGRWRFADRFLVGSSTESSAFIDYDEATDKLVYSFNGTDTYAFDAGTSGVTASSGISIISSAVEVSMATTTPSGLDFSDNDGLTILLDPAQALLVLESAGLAMNWDTTLMTASTTENLVYSLLTAGETITATTASPTAVVMDTNGDVYKAQNGTASTSQNFVGYAVSPGNAGDNIKVRQDNVIEGFTGLTPNSLYYFTYDSAGEISNATSTIGGPIIGKAISSTKLNNQWSPFNWMAGDNLIISGTTSESDPVNDTTYTKYESFKVGNGGIIRTSFSILTDNASNGAYGKIYINGTAIGSEHTTISTTYVTYEDEFSVGAGDEVELYLKMAPAGAHIHYKNFRIMAGNNAATYASTTNNYGF